MDPKESRDFRIWLLAFLTAASLMVYTVILYDTQVIHHEDYATQSVRSIARSEQVEASRGIITDRNGQVLVSNRSTYNLTFDASLLKPGEDQNQAILRLVQLCKTRDVRWIDNLPITQAPPYQYDFASLSDLQKSRFLSYLKQLKPAKEALTAYLLDHPSLAPAQEEQPLSTTGDGQAASQEKQKWGETLLKRFPAANLTPQLLESADVSASTLLSWMREDFKLPEEFTLSQARLVAGVRYEMSLRSLDIARVAYDFAEDIDTEFISVLTDGNYAGAKVTSAYAREYHTDSAGHILGTIGPLYADDLKNPLYAGYPGDATVGKTGAEAAFEEYLRGVDGRRVVSTNSDGKITGEYYSVDPKPGSTVELTIDLDFQMAAEAALEKAVTAMSEEDGNWERGAGLAAVKIGTGEVLALANYPTYSQARYYSDFEEIKSNPAKPLNNRATNGRYSPGSIFKPMVAVAALEEGVTDTKEKIRDTGYWIYPETVEGTGPWGFHCWYRRGHGLVNLTQAITVSCNSFFYEMGYRLGIEKLNEYALAFGLGRSTGIEIGDDPGLLAGPQERAERGGVWYGGDTVQAAIGQSDNLFTPLQMANYIATLASGGKHYDAHLLKSVKSYDNKESAGAARAEPSNVIAISDETLQAVREGMRDLTTTSLAGYFQNCVVEVGAKTGTVQTGANRANDGTFVCFAPYDDPEIAIAFVIEQGNSGSALASTAVEVLNAYFTPAESAGAVTGEGRLLP